MLEGPLFKQYFKKVEVSNFEVASDAFTTFKASLLVSKGNSPRGIGQVSLHSVYHIAIAANGRQMLAGSSHKAQELGGSLLESKLR